MTTIAADPAVSAVVASAEAALAAEAEAASAVEAEAASAVDSAAEAATAAEVSPAVAADAGKNNNIRIRGTEKCQSKKDAHISAVWG